MFAGSACVGCIEWDVGVDRTPPVFADGVRGLFESVFYSIVRHHFLFEDVCACLGRFLHLYDFAVSTAFTLLQRCYCFFSHSVKFLLSEWYK